MPGITQSFAQAAGGMPAAPPPGSANAVTLENLRQRAMQGDGVAMAQLLKIVSEGSAQAAAQDQKGSDKRDGKRMGPNEANPNPGRGTTPAPRQFDYDKLYPPPGPADTGPLPAAAGSQGVPAPTGLDTAQGPLADAFRGAPPPPAAPAGFPDQTMPPNLYPPPTVSADTGGGGAAAPALNPSAPLPAPPAEGNPFLASPGAGQPPPPQSFTGPVGAPGQNYPPMPPAPVPSSAMAPNVRDFGYKGPPADVVPPGVRPPPGRPGAPRSVPLQQPQQAAQPQPGPAAGPLHEGEPLVPPPGAGGTQAPAAPTAAANNAAAALGGSDWGRTLMEFGLNTMAAAGQRGATALGSIGQGGSAALAGMDKRAATKAAQGHMAFEDQMAVAKFQQDDRKILADLALRQQTAEQTALDRRLSREDRAAAREESNALRAQGQAIMAGNQAALQQAREDSHRLAVENSVRDYETRLTHDALANSATGSMLPAQQKEIDDKVAVYRKRVGSPSDVPGPDPAPTKPAAAASGAGQTFRATKKTTLPDGQKVEPGQMVTQNPDGTFAVR